MRKLLVVAAALVLVGATVYWWDPFGSDEVAAREKKMLPVQNIAGVKSERYPKAGETPKSQAAKPAAQNPAMAASAGNPAAAAPTEYVVKKGDTATRIVKEVLRMSRADGMAALQRLNPSVANWDMLRLGQKLLIPARPDLAAGPKPQAPLGNPALGPSPSPTAGAGGYSTYEVQPDDSLAYIARKFSLSGWQQIVAANPEYPELSDPKKLRDGMKLRIPR